MAEKFITIIGEGGCGMTLQPGMVVELLREKGNTFDSEAIRVTVIDEQPDCVMRRNVGFVANSVQTVIAGTSSAGNICDRLNKEDYTEAVILFGMERNGASIASVLVGTGAKKNERAGTLRERLIQQGCSDV